MEHSRLNLKEIMNFLVNNKYEITCPACSFQSATCTHNKIRYDFPANIFTCDNCKQVFINPFPDDNEIDQYYTSEYRVDYGGLDLGKRFNNDLPEAKKRLSRILKSNTTQTKSLLEIGSGSGAFISLANQKFDNVVAIEPDINSLNFIKSKNIKSFPQIDKLENSEKFDLIVLFHVLEHLTKPVKMLDQLSELLSEDGEIIIEVPNIDDALISLYKIEEFKDFYFCSPHLFYFSESTLSQLIKKTKNIRIDCLEFIQRYNLNNHLKWLDSRSLNAPQSKYQIFSDNTKQSYTQDLINSKKTDTLWAICSKRVKNH